MSQIEFDEIAHEYRMGGDKIPSVTQVIRDLSLSPHYPKTSNAQAAMIRGTRVHKLTERWDDGRTIMVDEEIEPYLDQWQGAKDILGGEIIHSELRVASDKLRYAGTLDRAIRMDDQTILILDIKTGGKSSWHRLQTAAYQIAFEEWGYNPMGLPIHRAAVYLSPDSFTISRHDSPRDLEAWKAAMVLHNWKAWNR